MKKALYRLYPFLIACYPVLALRNYNITYVDLASITRTLLILLALTSVSWLIHYLFFRDWIKAGVMTSLTMIIILSYGHIHIQSSSFFGQPIRHSYLLIIFATIYLLVFWLAAHKHGFVDTTQTFMATTSLILFSMSLGQSLYYDYGTYRAASIIKDQEQKTEERNSSSDLPDIYLIVLDAHGRSDVLLDRFGYDNSPFLRQLEDLGFYVADCSQSNYASTGLSLSSLFNLNYLPNDLGSAGKLPPLKETTLIKTLNSLGYVIINFENRASGHFDLQEDIRLSQNQLAFGELNLVGGVNEFEEMMLRTSIVKLFWDTELIPGYNENALVQMENYEHFQQTQFILGKLADIPQMKSPKFVFVHILVPHSPYVFTADGSFRKVEDKSRNGYRDNAEFIDQSILNSVKSILAGSEQPPIILLMGDHGPPTGKYATREDRMKNLNAYLISQDAAADLYPSITPVNSFRIIFDHYFGESYPLLDDTSYYAYKLTQLSDAPVLEDTCTPAQ